MNSTQSNTQTRMEISQHEQEPAETTAKADAQRLNDGETVSHRLEYKSLEIPVGNSELNNGLADMKEKTHKHK